MKSYFEVFNFYKDCVTVLFNTLIVFIGLELAAQWYLSTQTDPKKLLTSGATASVISDKLLAKHHFRYTNHHYLNYIPNPNYRSGKRFHNSLGFRNEEFPLKKLTENIE